MNGQGWVWHTCLVLSPGPVSPHPHPRGPSCPGSLQGHPAPSSHVAPGLTGMLFNQFLQWYRHLLLHSARVVDVARDVEQFGARVALAAKAGKPGTPTAADGGGHSHCLHIGHSCGAAKHPCEEMEQGTGSCQGWAQVGTGFLEMGSVPGSCSCGREHPHHFIILIPTGPQIPTGAASPCSSP